MPDPVKIVVEEGGKLHERSFDLETVSVGRTADNAIKVSDALSSRHHCRLLLTPAGWAVEDLKSRNGTRLNGMPLTETKLLSPGDRVQIGESTLHFQERQGGGGLGGEEKTRRKGRPSSSGQPVLADAGARLKGIAGESKGELVAIEPLPFTCGRKGSCSLTLSDHDVSNEHCMIVEDNNVLHLVDLGSTNGTFLNGQRLRGRAALREGAQIRLGATLTFQVLVGEDSDAAEEAVTPAASPRPKPKKPPRSDRHARKAESERKPKPKPKPAAAEVDEITDLDALEDEELPEELEELEELEESGGPVDTSAAEVVAQEALDLDFGASLDKLGSEEGDEAAAARTGKGGGQLGLIAVVISLLLVATSLGFAASEILATREPEDLATEENLVANWSFERTGGPQKPFLGWELAADGFRTLGGIEVLYGKRALRLEVAPGKRPQVRNTEPFVRVVPGEAYRFSAYVVRGPSTCAVLEIAWRSDAKADFRRSSLAVLTDPGRQGEDWEEVSGVVVAPPGANQAQLIAAGLSVDEKKGWIHFDRIRFQKVESPPKALGLATPSKGLKLRLTPRGVLSLHRRGEALAESGGLSLNPSEPLSGQGAARIDQPLSVQQDESLLALGAILDVKSGKRQLYAFSLREQREQQLLRWTLSEEAKALSLSFFLPRLGDLGGIELDGRALGQIPREGILHEGVREVVWGKKDKQITFRLSKPAEVTLRPLNKSGAHALVFTIPTEKLASGEFAAGFALRGASQRTRATKAGLLRKARTAKRLRRFAEAAEAYRELERQFHLDPAAVETSKEGLRALGKEAQRLVDVVSAALRRAKEVPVPAWREAARNAVQELEEVYPGSTQLGEAKRLLAQVEKVVREGKMRQTLERVSDLISRAKAARASGHLRTARMLYQYVLTQFPTTGLPREHALTRRVSEARKRLAAMPAPKGE